MTDKELRRKAFKNILFKRFDNNTLPSEKSNEEFARNQDKLLLKEIERLKKEAAEKK